MRIQRTQLLPRTQYVRDARLFVIAVEGEKTEAQYFALFGSSRVRVEVLPSGPDGLSAPKHILERLAKYEQDYDLGPDDERWLVFDVDRQRADTLAPLCQVAQESGYQLAISNPCFELWLHLHFAEADPADTTCAQFVARLKQRPDGYNKTRLDVSSYTAEAVTQAITRAKHSEQVPDAPWPRPPGTHVYKLVEHLVKHFRAS